MTRFSFAQDVIIYTASDNALHGENLAVQDYYVLLLLIYHVVQNSVLIICYTFSVKKLANRIVNV